MHKLLMAWMRNVDYELDYPGDGYPIWTLLFILFHLLILIFCVIIILAIIIFVGSKWGGMGIVSLLVFLSLCPDYGPATPH